MIEDYRVYVLGFVFIISFTIGMILMNVLGLTTIHDDQLNIVCKEIYGEDYEFHDNRYGAEINLTCIKVNHNEIKTLENGQKE